MESEIVLVYNCMYSDNGFCAFRQVEKEQDSVYCCEERRATCLPEIGLS